MSSQSTDQRAVWRLMVAQALAGANSTVIYATGSVIGEGLAPSPGLATLPISILVVGMATSTLPAGMIAERYGRRPVFLMGNTCGVLAGLLGVSDCHQQLCAVLRGDFSWRCVRGGGTDLPFRGGRVRGRADAAAGAGDGSGRRRGGRCGGRRIGHPHHEFDAGPYVRRHVYRQRGRCRAVRRGPFRHQASPHAETRSGTRPPVGRNPAAAALRHRRGVRRGEWRSADEFPDDLGAACAMHMHGQEQAAADRGHSMACRRHVRAFITGRLISRYGARTITPASGLPSSASRRSSG